jgi:Mlc titration factor MtfA (ptsG expression regulator)
MKNLTYARRIAVEDAIFYAQLTEQNKRQLTAQLLADKRLVDMAGVRLEAIQTIRKHLGLSRTRCRWLLDGKATLADFYEVESE